MITYLSVVLCIFGYLVVLAGAGYPLMVFLAMVGLAYRQAKTGTVES
jgi:hypothetical protein